MFQLNLFINQTKIAKIILSGSQTIPSPLSFAEGFLFEVKEVYLDEKNDQES